uniref:Uncharacterized protein n=1 Tax=Homalodisca liturata TaxID=320908 RepID=A0A1B6JTC8_9HEMI
MENRLLNQGEQETNRNVKRTKMVLTKEQEDLYNQKVLAIKTKYCPLLEKLMKRNIKEQLKQIKTIYDAITNERRLTMESLNKFEAILEKIYNMVMKPSNPDDKDRAVKKNPPNTDRSEITRSIKIGISNHLSSDNRNEPEIKKKSRWDVKQVNATDQLCLKLGKQSCQMSDEEKKRNSEISVSKKSNFDPILIDLKSHVQSK